MTVLQSDLTAKKRKKEEKNDETRKGGLLIC
jgi:hypothetical protein